MLRISGDRGIREEEEIASTVTRSAFIIPTATTAIGPNKENKQNEYKADLRLTYTTRLKHRYEPKTNRSDMYVRTMTRARGPVHTHHVIVTVQMYEHC